jgi:Protein of unknown function (DUF3574)
MRTFTIVVVILISLAYIPSRAGQATTPGNTERGCAPGASHMRTTLYFGLAHPLGKVSESQWQAFLRDEVTPRFPDGLTVWQADGQWRRSDGHISRERAKVLLLVHDETPAVRTALAAIVASYKRLFQQESVLWETAPVCAAF